MTKREVIMQIARACPDLANDVLALLKRLDNNGEFSGPAADANEIRFQKLCRDALDIDDFPEALRAELMGVEATLYAHGGHRPGAGRPSLPDREVRKGRSIKFSDAEWGFIKEKAEKEGLSISEFVRNRSLE